MPMTVISVCGRVRHIRPLPSDSTTHSVPVSAMAKFAPLMPTGRGQELAAQVPPGRLGQRGRVVGQARVDIAHLAQEDVADLGPVAVDGRHQDVRRAVMPELDDQLGQVGLVGRDARAGQRVVEADLVGDHRLDLDHLGGTGRLDQPGDDPVRLGRVPRPVHRAAAGGDLLLQLLQVASPGRAMVSCLDRLPGRAQFLPVRHLADHGGSLGPDGGRGLAEVAPQLSVGERAPGGDRERLVLPQVPDSPRRAGQAKERAHRWWPPGSPPGGRSAPRSAAATARRRCASGRTSRPPCRPRHRYPARCASCRPASPSRCRRSSPRTCRRNRSTPPHPAARPAPARTRAAAAAAAGRRPAAAAASGRSGGRSPGAGNARRRLPRRSTSTSSWDSS